MQSFLAKELILNSVMHVLAFIIHRFLLAFTALSQSQFYLLIQRGKHLSSRFWSYIETSISCFDRRSSANQTVKKIGTEILSNTSIWVFIYLGIYNSKRKKIMARGKISSTKSKYQDPSPFMRLKGLPIIAQEICER